MVDKVYVVTETTGEYEDRWSRPYKAYTDLEKAKAECERINEYYEKVYNTVMEGYSQYDNVADEIFKAHLKEVNPSLYQKVLDAERDDPDTDFNWDQYYEAMNDFEYDYDLLIKTAKESGISKEKIDFLEAKHELEPFNGDNPFYHVSDEPIELIS